MSDFPQDLMPAIAQALVGLDVGKPFRIKVTTSPGVTKRVDRHLSSPLRHLVSERNSGVLGSPGWHAAR